MNISLQVRAMRFVEFIIQETLNPKQRRADVNGLTFPRSKTHCILFNNKKKIQ